LSAKYAAHSSLQYPDFSIIQQAKNIPVHCTFWMICYFVSTNITGALHLAASVKQTIC